MRSPNQTLRCLAAAALLSAVLSAGAYAAGATASALYLVRKNDSLSSIAQAHGVRVRDLAQANGLTLESTIYAGQRLQIPSSARKSAERPGGKTVTVQENDSLTLIARRHGVKVAALAEANGLSLTETIHPGDKLRLPEHGKRQPRLDARVQRAIDAAPLRRGLWKQIVIHHSGTPMATVRGMDEYHRMECHMENGLAYHFVIGNGKGIADGRIEVGKRWIDQLEGGHLGTRAQNLVSLGVCLVGHFDQHHPTPKQMDSLTTLLRALMKRCGLGPSAIKTHQQVNQRYTRCPGKLFDLEALLTELRAQ